MDCKKVKGIIYINLISKCNELDLNPIELISRLYRLGHEYVLKIEFDTPIFVWKFITEDVKEEI
jgi:hypothetical protein